MSDEHFDYDVFLSFASADARRHDGPVVAISAI